MLANDASTTFKTSLVVLALGLLTNVFLSRWLGPEGRGLLAAAILIPTVVSYMGNFGIPSSLVYHFSRSRDPRLFSSALPIWLCQSVALTTLTFLLIPWMLGQGTDAASLATLYLAVIPISLLSQYQCSTMIGAGLVNTFNWVRLIIPVGYAIGLPIMFFAGRLDVRSILLLNLLLNLCLAVASMFVLLKARLVEKGWPELKLTQAMALYGLRVHIGDVSRLSGFRMDQVFILVWLAPSDLGLYVAALSAANLATILPGAVRMIMVPHLAKRASTGGQEQALGTLFRRYTIASGFLAIILASLLPSVIPGLFGSDFYRAIHAAEVLVLSAVIQGAKDVLIGGSQALDDPWLGSKAEMLGMVAGLISLPLLVPALGIVGAALSSVIAATVGLAIVISGLSARHQVSLLSLVRFEARDVRALMFLLGEQTLLARALWPFRLRNSSTP